MTITTTGQTITTTPMKIEYVVLIALPLTRNTLRFQAMQRRKMSTRILWIWVSA